MIEDKGVGADDAAGLPKGKKRAFNELTEVIDLTIEENTPNIPSRYMTRHTARKLNVIVDYEKLPKKPLEYQKRGYHLLSLVSWMIGIISLLSVFATSTRKRRATRPSY